MVGEAVADVVEQSRFVGVAVDAGKGEIPDPVACQSYETARDGDDGFVVHFNYAVFQCVLVGVNEWVGKQN